MKPLQFPVGRGIWGDARQELSSSAQFRYTVIYVSGAVRVYRLPDHASSIASVIRRQVVEHFMLSLFLSIHHFLQRHHFVNQQAVGLGDLSIQFLKLLDLLLRGGQLL